MDEERLCPYCDRLFAVGNNSLKKFCSRSCKEEFRKSGRVSKDTRREIYEEKVESWTKPDDIYAKDYKSARQKWRKQAALRSKFRSIKSHSKEEILELRNKATHCQLCGEVSDIWCADHDHKTGEFRGIICHHCNKGLGNFKDDVRRLEKAIIYLKKYLK